MTPWKSNSNSHVRAVEFLLKMRANVNAVADDGATPLWVASQNGFVEVGTVEMVVMEMLWAMAC